METILGASAMEVTPEQQLRYTRWENLQKHKQHKDLLKILERLRWDSNLTHAIGSTPEKVYDYIASYKEAHIQASKTFTVCPTCHAALLKSGKPRKSKKPHSIYACNICNDDSWMYSPTSGNLYQNRMISHKLTLAEANTYVRSTYPELFV